ncbi:baculoviral IAP repeat-containing protein 5a [Amia ocellicauda]|uniref:baculoviral IAP repeat-containing protein 5a n=1 Tax=Amia ocellicauda TaxID=2972642 RepID=UPI003464991A
MEVANEEHTKMYFYESRLETYSGWPFQEGCVCTPENMAKAGFIHIPTENCPDVAQCFFCYKELEGWEPDDDPVKEHKTHSPSCGFIALKKTVEQLTVEEFLKLQKDRQKLLIKKTCNQMIEKFEQAAKARRGELIKTAMDEE